jgi:hydroxymethylpyrimidine pyrophosphatase-like HAD family hydrolase
MAIGKKKTIFCDIDGTIFKYRKFETYESTPAEVIGSTLASLEMWNSDGHHIVLTTARPEWLRDHTVKELNENSVPYSQLIMGIGRGTRILINDRDIDDMEDRAVAINLTRDQGF